MHLECISLLVAALNKQKPTLGTKNIKIDCDNAYRFLVKKCLKANNS